MTRGRQQIVATPLTEAGVRPFPARADIVIIGAGITGQTAAVEAHKLAPERSIALITDQEYSTIHTPALKQFLRRKLAPEQLLAFPPPSKYPEGIDIIHAHAQQINPKRHMLGLSGDRTIKYGSLLIATGSVSRRLPSSLPGATLDGVLTFHQLQDYLDLHKRLPSITDAVVIGGGLHACDTAMGLAERGIHVQWLIRGNIFLHDILDSESSKLVLAHLNRHRRIRVSTATEVVEIVGREGYVVGVVTNRGTFLPCQVVISCIGTIPNTALALSCTPPLTVRNGIAVDDHFRTSAPHIYAAGDVAALRNPLTGIYESRAQWYTAVMHGRMAAASITGHEGLVFPPGVRWQATNLGKGLSLLMVGNPVAQDEKSTILVDTDKGNSYRRIAMRGGRLVGYLSLGRSQPDSLAIKRLIEEKIPIRGIEDHLLRADFDARGYISQWKAYQTKRLFIEGKKKREKRGIV